MSAGTPYAHPTRICDEPGCDTPAWSLGKCRHHAMVPLGQEDAEDRQDDDGGLT